MTLWSGHLTLLIGTALITALFASLVVCLRRPGLRLLAVLFISHALLLAVTPMWFLHYAGVIAAPLVLVLGGGLALVLQKVGTFRSCLPDVDAALDQIGLTALLAVLAVRLC